MKLAVLAFATMLGLGGAASADPAGAPLADPGAVSADHHRPRGQFRQLLLERFDDNHDGRLQPQERRRAIRTLRRLARRLAMQDRAERYGARHGARHGVRQGERHGGRARGVYRFDENRDGVVSPEEMPPGAARRLRRFDVNRDGWLDERDQPQQGPSEAPGAGRMP